jgi:hypothetical protein
MGAYRQGLSLWPQAYKCDSWFRVQDYRVDAILWKPSGVKGLESAVKTAYGNPCSVASDRDACRALALQRFERVQKLRAQIESQGPSTDTTCAQACQLLRSQLGDDSCTDKETAMRLIWDASIAKMYWNSDAKMAKAKDYYLNVEYPRGNALWNAQK